MPSAMSSGPEDIDWDPLGACENAVGSEGIERCN